MRLRAAPSLILSLAALVAALVALAVLTAALRQPWTGLWLGAPQDEVRVIGARGPSGAVPKGAVIESLAGGGQVLALEPGDLTVEPDGAMESYAAYHRFLARQETLSQILRSGAVELRLADGRVVGVEPAPRRPVSSLPVAFWVQCAVGLFAWAISASVFAFRRSDPAARYLLLSGAATLVFAPFAGVYSTRELALPEGLFQLLNDMNFLGGSLFAASFVALLLNYPRRIGPGWLGLAVVGIYIGWFIAQEAGFFTSMTFARRFLVLIGVFATFGLAGWHWFASRREPATRAALQWFLLSWVAGTGLFSLFILLPQMFGIDTSSLQGYAFLLFLLVYGGLAFGILRFRLFDLGRWWSGALLLLLTSLVLIGSDFLFLLVLHLSGEVSLALALLLCGVVWLPLRGLIGGRLFGGRESGVAPARFRQVTDIALAPPGADRQARWQALVAEVFRPLEIETGSRDDGRLALEEEGLGLRLPATDGLAALRLTCADGGRRLFGPRDVAEARHLLDMLAAAAGSREAYRSGVLTERGRIARDLHDNVGAQLMTALHSPGPERKDEVIRATMTGLREIIDDSAGGGQSWDVSLADLRHEAAERLHAAGITINWRVAGLDDVTPGGPILQVLRPVLREAVSNTLRHSGARVMTIALTGGEERLRLDISDDGRGMDPARAAGGNGLANMRARVDAVGGSFSVGGGAPGLRLLLDLPL